MTGTARQPLRAVQDGALFQSGIRSCVCVYRESELEVSTMMVTWTNAGSRPETLPPLHVSFIVDGSTDAKEHSPTFLALSRLLGIDPSAPDDGDAFGCRRFAGEIAATAEGDDAAPPKRDKRYPFEVWVKNANLPRGKRMSHRLYFEVLQARLAGGALAAPPAAIHFQDGDTGSERGLGDVEKLFLLLLADDDTGVVASKARPAQFAPCSWLLREQQLEYLEIFGSLGGYSLFRSVSCAIGMSVVYRWTTLRDGIVDAEGGVTVLQKYERHASSF